jgi:hypothetical protein
VSFIYRFDCFSNQLYPSLAQQDQALIDQIIEPSAPPPYSERDPHIPQVINEQQRVKIKQTVKPVYKGHSREPENVVFISILWDKV